MLEEYYEYLSLLYHRIPEYVFECGISLFVIGTLIILMCWGVSKGWRKVALLGLIEYVLLVYCSTIIFRDRSDIAKTNFELFDEYGTIYTDGSIHFAPEMLMNILVFVPIGILAGAVFKGKNWICAIITGCCISVSVEALQYVFRRGTAEIDDVIHNTIGCIIGYLLFIGIRTMFKS